MHKFNITAMCLSHDCQQLIVGDESGLIYIWQLTEKPIESGRNTRFPMQTFDMHKGKGAITNLVAIHSPLSLFGLTASMHGYEPGEIKALNESASGINDPQSTCT